MDITGFHLPNRRPSQTDTTSHNIRLLYYRWMEAAGVPQADRDLLWDLHWMVDGTGGGKPAEMPHADLENSDSIRARLSYWREDAAWAIQNATAVKHHAETLRVMGLYNLITGAAVVVALAALAVAIFKP